MHFGASYEKRTSRSKSRSPLRPSLKHSRSFSAYPSTTAPLGWAPAPAPAPAPWVHGATRITYPHVYPAYPNTTDTRVAVATYKPSYAVPGAYPATPPTKHRFSETLEPKSGYTVSTSTYTYQRPAEPLENPEVKAAIEHEQRLRMLSEKSHQETLKQQMLGMEIERVRLQRLKAQTEEASRQRMQRLYLLSQQEQFMAAQAHAHAQARRRAHTRHRSRSRHHRSRSRSSAPSIEHDEHRRSAHTHCRCGHHRGHYSSECRSCSHGHLLLDGPRSSAPALLPAPSRGRRSRRGSVAGSDEDDYAVYSDDEERGWYSDGNDGRSIPADNGVLVMYGPGGGPASRRSSMRHVVA